MCLIDNLFSTVIFQHRLDTQNRKFSMWFVSVDSFYKTVKNALIGFLGCLRTIREHFLEHILIIINIIKCYVGLKLN